MQARIATVVLAAFVACSPALADEQDSERSELWVTSGFASKHSNQQQAPKGGWNESNTGAGVEYAFSSNWLVGGGVYENSVYKTSRYLQFVWSPDLTTGYSGDWRCSLGAAVGVVDGYPKMRSGGYFPTLLPVASVEWKRVGVNLTYVPSVAANVAGAFALQAKFRFF